MRGAKKSGKKGRTTGDGVGEKTGAVVFGADVADGASIKGQHSGRERRERGWSTPWMREREKTGLRVKRSAASH